MHTGRTARAATAVPLLLAVTLIASSCSSTPPPDTPSQTDPVGSEGVPFGAGKSEYQAAFADVEPITLKIQSEGPEGSLIGAGRQAWADAIEEWSGGKITFEWGYSSSFVPSATEWASALGDGRLDVSYVLPYNSPNILPRLDDLSTASMIDGNASLDTLVHTGWATETIYTDPAYQDEASGAGIHLLTASPVFPIAGIFCPDEKSSLSELSGTSTSATGVGRIEQLKALGLAPTSIAFTEVFEALERNVVTCATTTSGALESIGAIDLVPYLMSDPQVSLVGFPAFLAISETRWNELPLAAQQLMIDRLDVYYATKVVGQGERNLSWLAKAEAAGGGILPYAEDARERLIEKNEEMLAAMSERGTDTGVFIGAHDAWSALVSDLYPDVDPNLQDFLNDGHFENIDLEPYLDEIFTRVLLPVRPG